MHKRLKLPVCRKLSSFPVYKEVDILLGNHENMSTFTSWFNTLCTL